jgi:tripartite-type tricarboxylate transporter receptor subunit TctC
MTRILAWFTAAAIGILGGAASAQDWPNKPVRFIVPFPPGGTVDLIGRVVSPHLSTALGQQVIVDNRPGASGSLGAGIAAKAAPDGYTFLLVFDTHGVNPSLIPDIPFDTLKDLDPLMLIATGGMVLTAHKDQPYKSLADVIAAAKAKPEAPNFGSIGNGSLGHLSMMLLQDQGGFRVTHVPYRGGGPLTTDVTAGQVQMGIATIAQFAQHIRAGTLRPLGVTSAARDARFADIPTIAEQGFPGFAAYAWWGLLATAGTPAPIQQRLHAEFAKVLARPDVGERLAGQGMDIKASSPAEFRTFLAGEIERWGKVVRAHKIQPD